MSKSKIFVSKVKNNCVKGRKYLCQSQKYLCQKSKIFVSKSKIFVSKVKNICVKSQKYLCQKSKIFVDSLLTLLTLLDCRICYVSEHLRRARNIQSYMSGDWTDWIGLAIPQTTTTARALL